MLICGNEDRDSLEGEAGDTHHLLQIKEKLTELEVELNNFNVKSSGVHHIKAIITLGEHAVCEGCEVILTIDA